MEEMMKRFFVFSYGLISYVVFFGCFLYAIGFIGNVGVPKSLDSGASGPWLPALFINAALLGLFAIQHSVMARQGFKRVWTKIIPEPAERSTYVLLSSLCLILLFWQWRPMGGVIWDVQNVVGRAIAYSLYGFGWVMLLVATFLINHFDLFGLRQVFVYLKGKQYKPLGFTTPWLYKMVRHPLYVGWLFIFWATPTMTVAHLVFAVATTAYILVAIQLEERDLVQIHGKSYETYQQQVPMLIPNGRKKNTLQEAIG
jgi:protein-S-isoprenylcysteine O-methyltransferase Ste14